MDDPAIVSETRDFSLSMFNSPVRHKFQLDFNCFNDLVSATYSRITSLEIDQRRRVSFASFSYYCGLLLWARLFKVQHQLDYNLSIILRDGTWIPKPIAVYLNSIGNFTDLLQRDWCLEFRKFNDSGDFGPLNDESFVYYMTLPAPRILIESIKKELKLFNNEMYVLEKWRIPELDPGELNADRAFNSNVQGYWPPRPITEESAGNLISWGITGEKFDGIQAMPGLIVNFKLVDHISNWLSRSRYPMVENSRLRLSDRGSICQIGFIESVKEEPQINTPYFEGDNRAKSFHRLDDCLTSLIMVFRLRACRMHRLDAYPYDFLDSKEIPKNWQNHLCDVFNSYDCEKLNSADFYATSVHSFNAIRRYIDNFKYR